MHRIIALWCHPRSMSTAIERLMSSRGDLHCLHEPFMYYYYLDQPNREMPYFHPQSDHATTYEGVKNLILSKAETSPVFFKDMSYYIVDRICKDAEFNLFITPCFLIRDPRASIASYHALDENLTLTEIGIESQWRHYQHLKSLGITPVVIRSETIRENPHKHIARWWDAIDLPYQERAFYWDTDYPSEWEPVKAWHQSVIASNSIRPREKQDGITEQQRFDAALIKSPHLHDYLEHHLPYYRKLVSVALC